MKAIVKFSDPEPNLPHRGKCGTLVWDVLFQPSREFIEIAMDRLTGYSFSCRIAADGNSLTFWNNILANDKTIECLSKSFMWLDIVIAED